ncbi:hypothetical protein LSH36_7g02007 [Paralvinella palmiformis]|uniref:Reelin domain-containing protein n=1 Tax=Paralvinella palmiformis TaxID=53620 RepID=A0AAD9KFU3_9ANNE|nr:hypothetical protein LSH36_7g02007 [Paralvinella palmiformis]
MAKFPLLSCLLISAAVGFSWAFQSSAPTSSCSTMMPRHLSRAQDHGTNPPPYQITIDDGIDTYKPNQQIDLVLHTSEPSVLAQGFILEARTVSDDKPVGTFVNAHKGTKIMCDDKAVSHYRTYQVSKTRYRMTWLAPDTDVGDVVFVATVVQSYRIFWTGVRSVALKRHSPTPSPQLEETMFQADTNVTSFCNEALLMPLPVERPHVAILCDDHVQCPCGWFCCPTCVEERCFGQAICRRPLPVEEAAEVKPESDEESRERVERREPVRRERSSRRSRTW